MPYRISYERTPDYLLVRMEGEEAFAEAIRFWQELARLAAEELISRFLIVDTVVGQLSTTEHFEISEVVARLFVGKRIAYVDPKEHTYESNQFGETVILNRGGFVKLFVSEADAHAWLTGETKPVSRRFGEARPGE
ncbi:MAG TPA: hypothetical protein VMC79_13505 [Rectinemataceae bacterium]|nr:hypothetical protein [Rectinemataceae bacterium]